MDVTIINDPRCLPAEFGELPSYLTHADYETVLDWCQKNNVPGRVIRFESRDGKLKYWAVVK